MDPVKDRKDETPPEKVVLVHCPEEEKDWVDDVVQGFRIGLGVGLLDLWLGED